MDLNLLAESAQAGDATAQFLYGYQYLKGIDVEKNQEYGIHWLLKAANQNHFRAQFWLSVCYHQGMGVDKDIQKSFYWLKKAAINGHSVSQCQLGDFFYYGNDTHKPDYKEAIKWYTKASEQGDLDAKTQLGLCYALGKGVDVDDPKAIQLFSEAAEKNQPKAQLWLGLYYLNAWTVEQDYSRAVYWFQKSANQNFSEAQYELGKCYKLGNGVEKNEREAFACFEKAAQNGLSKAHVEIGEYYLFDNPFSPSSHYNPTEAVKWFKSAIDIDDNPDAQSDLGMCYERGEGIASNYKEAAKLYLQSALQGTLYGKMNLVSLYKKKHHISEDYSDELFERAKIWCENECNIRNRKSKIEVDNPTLSLNENAVSNACINSHDDELEDVLNQLSDLVGLDEVKKEVNSIVNLLRLQNIRKEHNLPSVPISLHLVFSGNPGTGKTTVARLLAKIYYKLGILKTGQLIEVDRSGLVGGYVGQTAIKTQNIIQSALGGILFIDEAYTLVRGNDSSDFGQEAIDTILKAMEDYRDDFVVIVAGYPQLMEKFINSNPGLKSRFNKYIYFEDYTPQELLYIFVAFCNNAGLSISGEVSMAAINYFSKMYSARDEKFANARGVRNYFEKALSNQANRLAMCSNVSENDIRTLILQDVENIELN